MDNSGLVRQAAHALVKSVLSSIGSKAISPFFKILIAHLNCGLTHIKESIQLDSLKLLEMYLQLHPDLLMGYVGCILPPLMSLVSKQGTSLAHSSGLVKSRGLTSLINNAKHVSNTALVSNPSSSFASRTSQLHVFSLICRLLSTVLLPGNGDVDFLQDYSKHFGCLEDMVGVLVESWVECRPADVLSSKSPCMQSLSLLDTILNTLSVLVKMMVRVSDSSECVAVAGLSRVSRELCTHVLCHFPFKKSASLPQGCSSFVMNFTICETVLLLHKHLEAEQEDRSASSAMRYMADLDMADIGIITSSAQILPLCSQAVINMLPLVSDLCHRECVGHDVLRGVLTFVREFYSACHVNSKSKQLLVERLSSMFVTEVSAHCNKYICGKRVLVSHYACAHCFGL